jgi:hypothetical protein
VKVAVVSAVFGRYDEPVFVEQTVPCEYVLVTDGDCLVPAGWDVQVVNPGKLDSRLAGKFAKCAPWRFVDADVYVWLDGSILPEHHMVETFLDCVVDQDVAFYSHPHRTTIRSEAQASKDLNKYPGALVREQAQSYVDAGHPDNWGLWCGGIFVLRNTLAVRQMGERWLAEICRWTVQDQLSLPVALREAGLRPAPLPGTLLSNGLFKIRRHADRS